MLFERHTVCNSWRRFLNELLVESRQSRTCVKNDEWDSVCARMPYIIQVVYELDQLALGKLLKPIYVFLLMKESVQFIRKLS